MFVLVVILLVIGSTSSVPVATKADVVSIKDTLEQKYPDLVHWFERAAERVRSNVTASPEDLNNVREALKLGKQKIYNIVTSPFYDLFGDVLITQAVQAVSPFLGVMPLKELREFMKIMSKKPELAKLMLADPDEEESIVKILPNAALFENWFTNNTIKMVDNLMESTSSLAEDNMADFDVLKLATKHGEKGSATGAIPPTAHVGVSN